ncbi:aminopeptidase N-like isoform X2 [Ptychodera flava]|uniref:aminopeptidase N-like isoform X2 n=1 Tax=Ptychodera flava TaxID=63121 RepID=UPI00396A6471
MPENDYRLKIEDGEGKKSGLYLSNATIAAGIFAVIALCVGVGLLCYYVPDRGCSEPAPAPQPGDTMETPTEVAVTTPAPVWSGRVQSNVEPLHYSVHLKVYLDEDDGDKRFTFDGVSFAEFSFTEDTKTVKIHFNKLDIDDSKVKMTRADTGADVEIESRSKEEEYQFYVVTTRQNMIKGVTYRLYFEFVGYLEDDLAGFYRSSYRTSSGETRWLATTQFQATDARKAFPCFDEPALKATFDIILEHRNVHGRHAISNMPIDVTESSTDGDGKVWNKVTFEKTVRMSTYLLAFLVSDLECHRRRACRDDKCEISVCAREEMSHTVDYALNVTYKIINHFEDYFDILYPLPKQDQAAVPDFAAGAMENWGLILYRETAMLYDPDVSSATNKQRVAVVISHELAHQWFGNLMSPAWWDDLWLNEGFASYVEYLGVDHAEPDWRMKDQFVNEDLHNVFELDGLGSSHPILVPVNRPEEINEIFDAISYGKGASIIRMMNYILGEETFREGLTLFLNEQSYKAATSDDLWDALTRADMGKKDTDVKKVMDTWTLQMGYPVVTIKRTSTTTATAEQKHFLIDPDAKVETKYGDKGYKWYVKLDYVYGSSMTTPKEIMMDPEVNDGAVELDLSGSNGNEWILANIDQYGYYRVNYEGDNWVKLIQQLNSDHSVFGVINRAGLIDDAFNLARSGDTSQVTAFEITKYMVDEEDFLPWDAFLHVIVYIRDMLSRTGAFGSLEDYMLKQLTKIYAELTWDDSEDDHIKHFHRANVLGAACRYGHQPCIDEAKQQFKQWMDNPSVNNISPNLKPVVYCNGVRYGGVEEWDFMWGRYQVESDSGEKSRLQSAMSCSNEPWILSRYMEYALDGDKIKKQDASYTLRYVAANYVGRALAWDFFRAKYDTLFDMYKGSLFTWSRLLAGMTNQLNTEFGLQQLIEFGEDHPNLGSAARAYEQAIEGTKANIKWMTNNYDNVQDWLSKNKS